MTYFNDPIVYTAKNLSLLSFEYDTKDKPAVSVVQDSATWELKRNAGDMVPNVSAWNDNWSVIDAVKV